MALPAPFARCRPAGLPRVPRLRPRCLPAPSLALALWAKSRAAVLGSPGGCVSLSPLVISRRERGRRWTKAGPKPPRRPGAACGNGPASGGRKRANRDQSPEKRGRAGEGRRAGRAKGARPTRAGAPETGGARRQGGGLRTSDPQWHFRAKGLGEDQDAMRHWMWVASGVLITRAICNSIISGNTSNRRRPPPKSTGI